MPSGNERVTNRDLFDAITDLRKELKRDIAGVATEQHEQAERLSVVETDVKHLNRRVTAWDIGNSVVAGIAGILAYFGIRN
jgi:hypothetical protein